jgi:hypothetical protein
MEGHELRGSRIWAVCTDERLDLGVNIPVATDLWATGRIKGLCCAKWCLPTVCSVILLRYTRTLQFHTQFLENVRQKVNSKRDILTKQKLHNMGVGLKASLKKSLCLFTFQCGISRSTVHTATKLLKLQPYKMIEVQNLPLPNREIRIWYCTWFQESAVSAILDLELTFCSDEARK